MKNINDNTYGINLPDNISIFKTLYVSYIFYFYDDQPLYPELEVDLRLSLLQVKGIEWELIANTFMSQIDKAKPEKKFVKKLRHIKYETYKNNDNVRFNPWIMLKFDQKILQAKFFRKCIFWVI
jgi:hypothetical protein